MEVAPKDAPRNVLQTNDTDKEKLKNDTNKGELKNDKGDKHCSYFLKGQCRHGFSGKVTKDNVECCQFVHPKLCHKFLNNRFHKGGCKNKECEFVHLQKEHKVPYYVKNKGK